MDRFWLRPFYMYTSMYMVDNNYILSSKIGLTYHNQQPLSIGF
jgi:hypothetical protein